MIQIKREKDIEKLRAVALVLEKQVEQLRALVKQLTEEIRELKGEALESKQQELLALKEILAVRERALFGDKSEKRIHPKEELPDQANGAKKEKKGHGPTEQMRLPVIDMVHEMDAPDMVCPKCGGQLEEMVGQVEESEEITVVERRFVILRHLRKKYRCRCNGCVETAPGSVKLKVGSRYTPEFAVEVAAGKYVDHLPLQRQVKIMEREGLVIRAQTLWDQLESLSKVLEPTYRKILEEVLSAPVVYADETRWPMLGGKNRGKERHWLWAVASEEHAAYRVQQHRDKKAAAKMLEGYTGVVMADGYGAYEALARDGPQGELGKGKKAIKIKLAHCWAHVRRKFYELEGIYPEECKQILELIGELYQIEREVSKEQDEAQELAQRQEIRQERSRPVVEKIHSWAQNLQVLPQSGLAKARDYMMGMWRGLTLFLNDARVPLDNNHVERALRPPVVGRKNHYGSRSENGTRVAALFYSLVESAKMVGVDPKEYLLKATWGALKNPGTVTLPRDLQSA